MVPRPAGLLSFSSNDRVICLLETIWTRKQRADISKQFFKKSKRELPKSWTREAHLAQRAFDLPQEVVISQVVGVVVDVVHAKLEPLHHLKVVVQHKFLGKLRIQAVEDHLCAAKLIPKNSIAMSAMTVVSSLKAHCVTFNGLYWHETE